MLERKNATREYIPEIVKNEIPSLRIPNIVLFIDFGEYKFKRFLVRPYEEPEDESEYLVDITNYVENNPECLILDKKTKRIFLEESHMSEAVGCDKSLPHHAKRPPMWEWKSIVEQEESKTLGVLHDRDIPYVEKFTGCILGDDSVSTENESDSSTSGSTQSVDEKLTSDVDTVVRAVSNHWNFAIDQHGSRLCSLKDDNSASWYVGTEQVIEWATKYRINGKRFLNAKAYRVLASLIDDVSRKSTNRVTSGKKFVKLNNCLYVYNGMGTYYKVDKHGIKEDNISNCPVAFISDFSDNSEPYEVDTSGTEKDFINLIDRLNIKDDSRKMLKAWIVSAVMNTNSDTPIILFKGLKGTGKSTSMKTLGRILDSEQAPRLTPMPYSIEKLQYYAAGSWLKLFDNIRSLPHSYQDVLSVSATGGFIPMRKLYTTNQMEMFSILGPVVLSTVHDIRLSSDLLDRIIVIESKSKIKNAREIPVSTEDILKARGGILKMISNIMNITNEDFLKGCNQEIKGRFPAFYRTIKALENIYPDDFDNAVISYGREIEERDKDSLPLWIKTVYEENIVFSGSASEVVDYLESTIGDYVPIPSKYRILSEWNEYEWFWEEKFESVYKRSKKKRIWELNLK